VEVLSAKQLGWILIGTAVAIFFVHSFMVNEILALQALLHKDCTLPENICPFKSNIPIPAVIGYLLDVGLGGLGAFLILSKRQVERIMTESQQKWKKIVKGLEGEERQIYELIGSRGGFVFQNELVEKSGMNKVKVTRVLDKLEAKGLVERRRRGMSNVVTLKYS